MTARHACWAAVLVVAGCGPQLDQLVAKRHYREAICAAHDGSAGDRDAVQRALAADARALVHVDMMRTEQLARVVGDAAEAVTRRARFARIRVRTDVLPVDDLEVAAAFTRGGRELASVPVNWSSLAAATGEPLPPQVARTTYAHPGTTLKVLGAVLTAGALLPFIRFDQREILVDAPRSEYDKLAPRASALLDAMAEYRFCVEGSARGISCSWFVAIGGIDPSARIQLDVMLRYRAKRTRYPDACTVEQTISIPLGRVAELDATTARIFGSQMRPLAAVGIAR